MDRPLIRVVGLGPGGPELMTVAARDTLVAAPVARLRTRRHPAADLFPTVPSYDDLYDRADSFDALYEAIVEDLVGLAHASPSREVAYAVPGSPVVAERTVELLRERDDVTVLVEPAVSVVDLACARLGWDPLRGLSIADALSDEPLRGPGPTLVLQTHDRARLADLGDRLPPDQPVTVLHHLGLADEEVVPTTALGLGAFGRADHLTSVWVPARRTVGDAMEDLAALTTLLREQCAWDRDQDHASLLPHLLEESHEALAALERYVNDGERDPTDVIAELGDLLYQVCFHAELGREVGAFDLTAIMDGLGDKLRRRHPHVFEGHTAESAAAAESAWEARKAQEVGPRRADDVPVTLPAFAQLFALRRRADGTFDHAAPADLITTAVAALRDAQTADADQRARAMTVVVDAVCDLALRWSFDVEGQLRGRATQWREQLNREGHGSSST